jgi:hypothetical protein
MGQEQGGNREPEVAHDERQNADDGQYDQHDDHHGADHTEERLTQQITNRCGCAPEGPANRFGEGWDKRCGQHQRSADREDVAPYAGAVAVLEGAAAMSVAFEMLSPVWSTDAVEPPPIR